MLIWGIDFTRRSCTVSCISLMIDKYFRAEGNLQLESTKLDLKSIIDRVEFLTILHATIR